MRRERGQKETRKKKAPEEPKAPGFVDSAPTDRPPARRQLIGFFPADASAEAIADAIIAALPPEKRPVDDPARIAWEEARKDRESSP